MSKKAKRRKEDSSLGSEVARAQRRLARMQIKLHEAQARRARVIARGEQKMERVRRKVNQSTNKATERVERLSVGVAAAENSLLALTVRREAGAIDMIDAITAALEENHE